MDLWTDLGGQIYKVKESKINQQQIVEHIPYDSKCACSGNRSYYVITYTDRTLKL